MKNRGKSHTTLTETSTQVVQVLRGLPGIKMIAPGEIRQRRSSSRHITVVRNNAGFVLLISGQAIQRINVHTISSESTDTIIKKLNSHKALRNFVFKTRDRILK